MIYCWETSVLRWSCLISLKLKGDLWAYCRGSNTGNFCCRAWSFTVSLQEKMKKARCAFSCLTFWKISIRMYSVIKMDIPFGVQIKKERTLLSQIVKYLKIMNNSSSKDVHLKYQWNILCCSNCNWMLIQAKKINLKKNNPKQITNLPAASLVVMRIALWYSDHTASWVLFSLTAALIASLLCKLSLVLLSEMILMQSSSAKPLLSICTGVAGGRKHCAGRRRVTRGSRCCQRDTCQVTCIKNLCYRLYD